jgi:hypothetical protein
MNKITAFTVFSVASTIAMPALAAESVITNLNSSVPAGTSWGILPGENTGSVTITDTAARSGNGSLEITGDRTRVQTGVQYAPFTTNIGLLSDATSLTFDWQNATDSSRPSYSPALRLLTQDGSARSELIWESANQPGPTPGTSQQSLPAGNWYSSTASDLFYRNVAGAGPTFVGASQTYVLMTLAQWAASDLYGADTTVSGISVGAGSGAGANYHAFADNVTYKTTQGATTYNFETLVSAAPEPATWGMMIVGFGIVGGATRRQKRRESALAV